MNDRKFSSLKSGAGTLRNSETPTLQFGSIPEFAIAENSENSQLPRIPIRQAIQTQTKPQLAHSNLSSYTDSNEISIGTFQLVPIPELSQSSAILALVWVGSLKLEFQFDSIYEYFDIKTPYKITTNIWTDLEPIWPLKWDFNWSQPEFRVTQSDDCLTRGNFY